MSRVIEIIISPNGTSRVETRGFTGSTCRDASRFVEEALGERTGEQLTGEYFAQEIQRQSLREGSP